MAKNIKYFNVSLIKEKAALIEMGEIKAIKSPYDCHKAILNIFNLNQHTQEHMVMLALDTKNNIAGAFTVHVGTVNSSIVHPRDIFQRALLCNATSIVLAHNHPSGSTAPSPEDVEVTKRLLDAGKIIGIELLDHLIIGDDYAYLSLKEKGYI